MLREARAALLLRADAAASVETTSNEILASVEDYDRAIVRSKIESIDCIIPSTHGECVAVRRASDVSDLLTEFHVSHTLLSLVDSETGHPISGLRKTLPALTRMLRSGMPGSLSRQLDLHQQSSHLPVRKERKLSGPHLKAMTACPNKLRWSDDLKEIFTSRRQQLLF
ncbi:hypothetical protein Tco_0651670 [Tanacetum coccineum]|uniref:Uncharacterized protein n=1 Tax=Tanacetum coccineum TaxID=301880 RepID=A0ABQ4WVG7_9ASTR